jgi:hypothetical protein
MNITLTDNHGNMVNATVTACDFVTESIALAWQYIRVYGRESVTVREAGGENAGARIVTVSCVIHDE